jgi:hypothetical protein
VPDKSVPDLEIDNHAARFIPLVSTEVEIDLTNEVIDHQHVAISHGAISKATRR